MAQPSSLSLTRAPGAQAGANEAARDTPDVRPRRVVLLIPTRTYRAAPFLAAAAGLGADVVVGSEERPALAGLMGEDCIELDFDQRDESSERLVALAHRRTVDAVLAVDTPALALAAQTSARLGLAGNPVAAIHCALDKQRTRERLGAAGIAQPCYAPLGPDDEPGTVARTIGFPCVIKPRDGAASRGVLRADDAASARHAVDRIRDIVGDPRARLLIEAFVPGPEVAVEGLLTRGRLQVLAVYDKPDRPDGPYFEETLLVTPSTLPAAALDSLHRTTEKAAHAIGLREGPLHAELRIDGTTPRIIEVNPRSIGGHCSRMLRFTHGASLEEVLLRHALGMRFDATPAPGASGVLMLSIPRPGILRGIDGLARARAIPAVEEILISVPTGDHIEPPPAGERYLGFAFARATTTHEVTTALRAVRDCLRVVVEPRQPMGHCLLGRQSLQEKRGPGL